MGTRVTVLESIEILIGGAGDLFFARSPALTSRRAQSHEQAANGSKGQKGKQQRAARKKKSGGSSRPSAANQKRASHTARVRLLALLPIPIAECAIPGGLLSKVNHEGTELLLNMGYDSPEVTPRGGDGGVDVVASIERGITTVTEVI